MEIFMNISKAARQTLIPIEKDIMNKSTEYGYQLTNLGKSIANFTGTKNQVLITSNNNINIGGLIFTHNHPQKSFLSITDINTAIARKYREFRTISANGRCHLVEISKMTSQNLMKCLHILNKYDFLIKDFIRTDTQAFTKKEYWNLIRKMRKDLEKVGGLKFRTIKLPE
jgi:hypothetical protein